MMNTYSNKLENTVHVLMEPFADSLFTVVDHNMES